MARAIVFGRARSWLLMLPATALALVAVGEPAPLPAQAVPREGAATPVDPQFATRCAALSGQTSAIIGRIERAGMGGNTLPPSFTSPALSLAPHCEVFGIMQERSGAHRQNYAIRYHMRLPQAWNGRFLFQGGGGTNGEVGDASGPAGIGVLPAIARGFAVISQDSGHDNRRNIDPSFGGTAVFGTDAEARANYGHASLPLASHAGKALIESFYGQKPRHSYFYGCSKGGQEGMAFAQRYPDEFDGIVAAAPGFALPRAALNQAWSVQQFGALARLQSGVVTPSSIAATFSPADLDLVRSAILKACDAADGLADGLTSNLRSCTTRQVQPQLRALSCKGGKNGQCLSPGQINTLSRVMAGPRDGKGRALYSDWAWDAGVGSPMWSMWRLGIAGRPAMDITLGGAALPTVFSVPPQPVAGTQDALLANELALKFPAAEGLILAHDGKFPQSAWADIAMRSPNLDGFLAHGGKLLVAHGAADPVFSVKDTIAWWDEVKGRYGGRADDVVRLFVVPGMAHCGGGPTTDQFDMLAALIDWVEHGKAPQRVEATAGVQSPWPGRTRPLCAWPGSAYYESGDHNLASSFACRKKPATSG